ncbi:hypothetical protein VB618_03800 [Microvirga sp. CF3062]|uniref:hypothetical protein n=1 Tax=Microvirga sp. CF3062 TaxID=3110182 RepID=UPI002E77F8A6|nr:hypothetical protein [Microvirga sp. CF3062]MEE1655309.1 hypothetical protein [Microvirga sp. CF3062]
MLVYGDIERIETVGAKQAAVASFLSEAFSMPPGIERHGALVTAFISASELVQGIIDAEFHERGFDAHTQDHEAGMECLSILARTVGVSLRSRFGQLSPLPNTFFEKLHGFDPSRTVRTKQAEGYAFYALYPESYLEAARVSGLGPDTQIIGIRSIGTGLSALVAAELGAPAPITLRPVGHPFGRQVRVDPDLTRSLASSGKAFAIVDEGPGLSGSSFGAVADWLEEAGISQDRIHFFPSHCGALGPQASARHRARWGSAPRHLVTMDDLLLHGSPAQRLESWVEDLLGQLDGPLEEISGGAWRSRRYEDEGSWPPANIQQERRKFLARANGTAWLVKFVGLGKTGAQKLRMARELHEAGFTPEPAGCRHGFLVERWHEELDGLGQAHISRESLVAQVGAYLGFRARHFPAAEHQGASLDALRRMAVYNTGQALGEAAAAALEQSLSEPSALAGKVHRICTDNRLHAWEWLVSGDRLIKTDALDHSAAHDLIGHQDVSWDVAGAIVELDLSEDEAARLCQVVRQESGRPLDQALLAFMLPCYLAFQLGAHLMAAGALGEGPEATRLRRGADRYGRRLQSYLTGLGGPEPLQEQDEVPAS